MTGQDKHNLSSCQQHELAQKESLQVTWPSSQGSGLAKLNLVGQAVSQSHLPAFPHRLSEQNYSLWNTSYEGSLEDQN